MSKFVGKVVICKTAQGHFHSWGIATSYCDAPTYGLIAENGAIVNWREDLTTEATPEQCIEYWQNRAMRAEKKSPPERTE